MENMTIVQGVRVGTCGDCGRRVRLEDSWENECRCGALYNAFGQALARPEYSEYELAMGFDN
jgi:hypothetical protein